MGWIRLDDRFAEHPKILELTDRELRVHVNALCYTARAQDPHITPAALRVLGATARQAGRLVDIGVWDVNDNGWVIHDWQDYQRRDSPAREKQQTWKAKPGKNIYSTQKWRRTRQEVFERDHGVCVDCGLPPEEQYGNSPWNADHEPPVEELLRQDLDLFDLQYIYTRCHSCHAKKTRRQDPRAIANKTNDETE